MRRGAADLMVIPVQFRLKAYHLMQADELPSAGRWEIGAVLYMRRGSQAHT